MRHTPYSQRSVPTFCGWNTGDFQNPKNWAFMVTWIFQNRAFMVTIAMALSKTEPSWLHEFSKQKSQLLQKYRNGKWVTYDGYQNRLPFVDHHHIQRPGCGDAGQLSEKGWFSSFWFSTSPLAKADILYEATVSTWSWYHRKQLRVMFLPVHVQRYFFMTAPVSWFQKCVSGFSFRKIGQQ